MKDEKQAVKAEKKKRKKEAMKPAETEGQESTKEAEQRQLQFSEFAQSARDKMMRQAVESGTAAEEAETARLAAEEAKRKYEVAKREVEEAKAQQEQKEKEEQKAQERKELKLAQDLQKSAEADLKEAKINREAAAKFAADEQALRRQAEEMKKAAAANQQQEAKSYDEQGEAGSSRSKNDDEEDDKNEEEKRRKNANTEGKIEKHRKNDDEEDGDGDNGPPGNKNKSGDPAIPSSSGEEQVKESGEKTSGANVDSSKQNQGKQQTMKDDDLNTASRKALLITQADQIDEGGEAAVTNLQKIDTLLVEGELKEQAKRHEKKRGGGDESSDEGEDQRNDGGDDNELVDLMMEGLQGTEGVKSKGSTTQRRLNSNERNDWDVAKQQKWPYFSDIDSVPHEMNRIMLPKEQSGIMNAKSQIYITASWCKAKGGPPALLDADDRLQFGTGRKGTAEAIKVNSVEEGRWRAQKLMCADPPKYSKCCDNCLQTHDLNIPCAEPWHNWWQCMRWSETPICPTCGKKHPFKKCGKTEASEMEQDAIQYEQQLKREKEKKEKDDKAKQSKPKNSTSSKSRASQRERMVKNLNLKSCIHCELEVSLDPDSGDPECTTLDCGHKICHPCICST